MYQKFIVFFADLHPDGTNLVVDFCYFGGKCGMELSP